MIKNLAILLISLICSACSSHAQNQWFGLSNVGVTVNSSLMKGAAIKYGVKGTSDTGRYLFGFAEMNERNVQTSGYGGMGLPQWVDVIWREPIYGKKYIPTTGNTIDTLDFGETLGSFRVEVASRIPKEVLQYVRAKKGRTLVLMFRVLDDDVVLGWSVREIGKSKDWFEPNYGGDFMPAIWADGKLMSMGWYLDRKTGQRVPTATGD